MILTLLLISIISLIITEDFEPLIELKEKLGLGYNRLLRSKYKVIDILFYIIHKIVNCAPCLSYHLTWIIFLILGSWYGLILGLFTYLITRILFKYIWSVSL